MLLYQHHTYSDVIDFNRENSIWSPVPDEERPPTSGLPITLRDSYPICGSYTVENDKRYYMYWTSEREFVFRTPDHTEYRLFKKINKNDITNLSPNISIELSPAKHSDGRPRIGYSDFLIKEKNGKILYEETYFSKRYLDFYMHDFTPDPDLSLSDWDFFVAFKEAVKELSEQAQEVAAGSPASVLLKPETAVSSSTNSQLYAHSGNLCSKDGYWAVMDDLQAKQFFKKGDRFPVHQDREVTWVWVPQ